MSLPLGDDSSAFHEALRRLPEIGTPVKLRSYRQIWLFEHGGKTFYLKFFPRRGQRLKRLFRGDPAKNEFDRLVQLQKAGIPAPRAVAYLSGLVLKEEKGDAVLTLAIEPAVPLDALLHGNRLAAKPVGNRRELHGQVVALLKSLARAGLGHSDLHFGNFLLSGDRVYLLDPSALHGGGLSVGDLAVLAHASRGLSTRTERLRAWRALTPPGTPPPRRPMAESRRFWSKRIGQVTQTNEHTERIVCRDSGGGEWSGVFFKLHRFPHRHSKASGLKIGAQEWQREFPKLLQQLDAGLLRPLKQSQSADVFEGSVVLAGVPVAVVVKRAKRKHAYRYVTELGRGSRAYRAWRKSWMLVLRNIPVAWPLIYLDRKAGGVVVDQLFIAEKVEGPSLGNVDLEGMDAEARALMLRRMGKLLREIDETGLVHFDTKGSNFIVRQDPALGPVPVAIDPDGIRPYSYRGFGIKRLLKSLRERHAEWTAEDEAAVWRGYGLGNSEIRSSKSETNLKSK